MKTLFIILLVCATNLLAQSFSIEGHRGTRGYLPENTIPSFLKAIELGADTIELDVVVSSDGKIVVSHDPWFSALISTKPDGSLISAKNERELNLFRMKYADIKKYDVGLLGNKDFPQQMKMKAHKPLLRDVFAAIRKHTRKNKTQPIRVNIEIKSNPTWDNIYTPAPAIFAKMVYDEILKYKMQNNVIVQSFDVRQLQEFRRFPVQMPLAILVGNKDGIEKNIELLGFIPDTYSPHFSLVDENTINFVQKNKMKIVPWTVNEIADLEKMKKFKLDGVITDYPDRAVNIFRK